MADTIKTIVEFRSVNYTIGDTRIIEDVSVAIPNGEIMILLGESGCGKTTTLKLINRLIEPTSGEVLVEGMPTTQWNSIKLRRHIGYVLQDGGLFPHMTVAENISLVLKLQNWHERRKASRTTEMLELVGLDSSKFAERFPSNRMTDSMSITGIWVSGPRPGPGFAEYLNSTSP